MKQLAGLLLVLLLCLAPGLSLAVNPDEMLADPALEARARTISEGLRCLVCQNQSIDDSDADLAHDLRVLVRERLVAGDSNDAVVQYIVDRYGEYVLLRPVFAVHTLFLWIAAPVLLLAGLVAVFFGIRRKRLPTQAVLTDEESAALATLANDAEQ
jgi:cytochrome c-type biogenesis protein CcmH